MASECQNGILRVSELVTGYGKKQVVNGVTLGLAKGEIVALIGHNGAGKSTLLKAVFGLIRVWSGQVYLDGQAQAKLVPRELLRAGVAYVPQGNRVFADLTVYENLEMGGITLPSRERLREGMERVFGFFREVPAWT